MNRYGSGGSECYNSQCCIPRGWAKGEGDEETRAETENERVDNGFGDLESWSEGPGSCWGMLLSYRYRITQAIRSFRSMSQCASLDQ